MRAISSQKPLLAIVGFGAIGRDLVERLRTLDCDMKVLLASGTAAPATVPANVTFVHDLESWLTPKPDLVIEAAGQQALKELAPSIMARGVDILAASVGVAGDATLMAELGRHSQQNGTRLIFPTGAVGGIDYLEAVSSAADLEVTYISRKPVAAWSAELQALGHDPSSLAHEVTIFEGDATEAARLYPRNLNAGLTIALAAGIDRTKVCVVADPAVSLNTHEITTRSKFGTSFMRFANKPSPDNPKTSAITPESLFAAVKRYFPAGASEAIRDESR